MCAWDYPVVVNATRISPAQSLGLLFKKLALTTAPPFPRIAYFCRRRSGSRRDTNVIPTAFLGLRAFLTIIVGSFAVDVKRTHDAAIQAIYQSLSLMDTVSRASKCRKMDGVGVNARTLLGQPWLAVANFEPSVNSIRVNLGEPGGVVECLLRACATELMRPEHDIGQMPNRAVANLLSRQARHNSFDLIHQNKYCGPEATDQPGPSDVKVLWSSVFGYCKTSPQYSVLSTQNARPVDGAPTSNTVVAS
ncbi:hypothetical protein CYLTODRAFT_414960 [Cylindrobasidium torrendii FP15055 ss-10]|uniref:Uncharacterized protein n=1 Tax=Cylindrobasidium torrendii FP15055 ss-10 TaxID=1314674 RepID=A0A0D7AUR7_9AGAR|nr:hypothetical protein CYLTODRAFT_414960 [Cylindrobasidium torrendii FP15055 ss-10]